MRYLGKVAEMLAKYPSVQYVHVSNMDNHYLKDK